MVAPIIDEAASPSFPPTLPTLTGVTVKDKDAGTERQIKARFVVVADGANSRVGRMLGTERRRDLPLGMALRGYYTSDRHDDPFIESHLDIRDADGTMVPGYGWIFPMGDGRVNVGVGLLSTDRRWKGINTSHLMDAFVNFVPKSWGLSPETCLGPPTGGKLPMGLSVGPRAGGNVILAGDAAGTINPFNGEGIAYGYETGRLAAAALGHALSGQGVAALRDYDLQLDAAYGAYYKVARAFVRMISNPQAMKVCVGMGMRSEFLMSQLLRIMANLMRPDSAGPAEVGFRAMELVSRLLPDEPRPAAWAGTPPLADQSLRRTGEPTLAPRGAASQRTRLRILRPAAPQRSPAPRRHTTSSSAPMPRQPVPANRAHELADDRRRPSTDPRAPMCGPGRPAWAHWPRSTSR